MSSKRAAKIAITSAAILVGLCGGLYALVMWEGSKPVCGCLGSGSARRQAKRVLQTEAG